MATVTMTTVSTGLQELLNTGIKGSTDLVFHLFSNNAAITEATVLGDLTETLNYTAATLTAANWTISYTTVGQALYTVQLDFTAAGAMDVYGGFITNTAGTVLIAAGNKGSLSSFTVGQVYSVPSVTLTLDN